MDSQQPKPYETGPKGYAQLSEEDSYSPNAPEAHNQQHALNHPYGAPVIAQGIPVMSYPAPMSNFEIYNPNASQPHKLDSCGFSCYKIWLIINILLVILKAIGGIAQGIDGGDNEYEPSIPGLKLVDFVIDGWSAFIFILAFSAVREKNLQRIDRALTHMKYFLIVKGVYTVVALIDAYEVISDRLKEQFPEMQLTCNTGSCQAQHYIAGIVALIVGVGINLGMWFVLIMLPAINAQKLLRRTAPVRSPVENC